MTDHDELIYGIYGVIAIFLIIFILTCIPSWIYLAVYLGIGIIFGGVININAYDEQYKREQYMLDQLAVEDRRVKFEEHQLKTEEYKALQETGHWINPEYKENNT